MKHTDPVIRLHPDMIHNGQLVLVNQTNPVVTSLQDCRLVPLTTIQQAGTEEQELRLNQTCLQQLASLLEACHALDNIGVVSGYRSQEQQKHIYDTSLLEHGAEFTASYVARPGESEHQTGLAVDVGQLLEDVDYLCPSFPDHGIYASFKQLAAEYGFIQRYQEGKEHITNIACEPWHYRYVGVPHSILMEQHELCLEEYIMFLKQFPFGGSHLHTKMNNQYIEIYYIRAEDIEIWLPIKSDSKYEWSGNNSDGFIITMFHEQEQGSR